MSLINDALKRASQSDKNRPAQAPLPRAMQPAAPTPRGGNSTLILIAVIVVAVVGLVVSGWFYLSSRNTPPPIAATVPPPPVRKAITEMPAPAQQPAPVVQKTLPPPVTPAPTPVVVAAPAAPIVPPETFPTNLTVKAIFYNKTNPRALVNGQTVETGDKIGDVLVTGIMTDRVFLDWRGQSKVLIMGGQ